MGQADGNTFKCLTGDVTIPTVSVPAYALHNTTRLGSKPAFVDGLTGRSYSFAEVAILVRNTAAGLASLGIRQGDAVMVVLPNSPEYPLVFLGIIAAGGVASPANPAYAEGELRKQLADSHARLIITDAASLDKVSSFGVPLVVAGGDAPSGSMPLSALFSADGTKAPAVSFAQDDTCILPYSSGTTGSAKGVMLTHRNLVANVEQHLGGNRPRIDLRPDDVVLGLLPMFHIYAITSLLLTSIRAGVTVVTVPRFELTGMLALVQGRRITIGFLVPPIILALAKLAVVERYDLSSLRLVVSGAAPLGPDLEGAFRMRFPRVLLGQGYGMTESSPVALLSRAFAKGGGPACPGSAGALMPNTEARIIDTSSGLPLPANQRGELLVRGPQVMKGYLNNEEATRQTVDAHGWLHTGDVAYASPQGDFFIVDRVKELIKYKGFQVPPAELENILLSHASISDAAVVPLADEEAGELPVAFVVTAGGTSISEQQVKDFVAGQVATYKRLHRVIFTDVIPKSAAGKILRRELRARL